MRPKLPKDVRLAYDLVCLAPALELTRSEADPASGPLAGYVIDVELADVALAEVPWKRKRPALSVDTRALRIVDLPMDAQLAATVP